MSNEWICVIQTAGRTVFRLPVFVAKTYTFDISSKVFS